MPRPFCRRRIAGQPAAPIFKPISIPLLDLEEVVMSLDEFEAIRLADLDGLYQEQAAEQTGLLLARHGLTVLCGGRAGVMEAVCRGVAEGGGLSIGLLPDTEPDAANPHVTVPLATGIGVARNALIARAAHSLIAIGGGYGTLSEIAFALQFGRPVFLLEGAPAVDGAIRCASPGEALEQVARAVLRLPESETG